MHYHLLVNTLAPTQEMLRSRIRCLKCSRILIDVGYAGQPAFFEGQGEVLNVDPQGRHWGIHDEIYARLAIKVIPDLMGLSCPFQS
jgi:hypothetical protein